MRKLLLALATIIVMASSARADVIYSWVPSTPPPVGISAFLRVTDEARQSGSIKWNSTDYADHSDAPVVSGMMMLDYPGYPGGEWQNQPLEGYYDFTAWFDITFVGNGIAGSMYMRWGEEGASTGDGTAQSWTFDIRNVAAGGIDNPCFAQGEDGVGCIVSGRWVGPSVAAVPIPGTLALLAVGLVLTARKRTPAVQPG